jgi:hypothetical protein
MSAIDQIIIDTSSQIDGNIARLKVNERDFWSINIVNCLRDFVESIAFKIYITYQKIDLAFIRNSNQDAMKFVKSRGNLSFLWKFHGNLQKFASHSTPSGDYGTRLLLKYFSSLTEIKAFLKSNYNLDVLSNLEKYPLDLDSELENYYKRISEKVELANSHQGSEFDVVYYVVKSKLIYVDHKKLYEITLSPANDYADKFDRFIAFSNFRMLTNYAIKPSFCTFDVEVFGKFVPIKVIRDYLVSVRPCEFDKMNQIFGSRTKVSRGLVEYRNLMAFLKDTHFTLGELIQLSDEEYMEYRTRVSSGATSLPIFTMLDRSRNLVVNHKAGSRVVLYLLDHLHNKVIKWQNGIEQCDKLSNLYLSFGSIPFDKMPFAFSLRGHNPSFLDLVDCFGLVDREWELLTHIVNTNTNGKGILYTSLSELSDFSDVPGLAKRYNDTLYYKHAGSALCIENDYVFIKQYEHHVLQIVRNLISLTETGVDGYSDKVMKWLEDPSVNIDDVQKKNAIKVIFDSSKVAIIYGAAGTGKTFLINLISSFFKTYKKKYLAVTNSAVENLKRNLDVSNSTFSTVASFLVKTNIDVACDVLIIDECSTVCNADMVEILSKAQFQLIMLVGDVYQIESITFGNWFKIVRNYLPSKSVTELTEQYRCKNNELKSFWEKVRKLDEAISESIVSNRIAHPLDETIFAPKSEDEIILCLGYDGLYGINNINRYLQISNRNPGVEWEDKTYKVGDPILFNQAKRFWPIIYPNLKGKIVEINKEETRIRFVCEIDKLVTGMDVNGIDLTYIGNSFDKQHSIVGFYVNKYKEINDYDDETSNAIIPFHVAYAVSIHKAQGLEYESVKIVITNDIEDRITHNIFYTAITRARTTLTIYWSPETQTKILASMKRVLNDRDEKIFESKYGSLIKS